MISLPGHRENARFVSVIVPAYNAAATIDETLLSVRRQTHARIEIIVVNDGSTDATPNIARAHARVDSRVRIVDTTNAGVAAARNTGVAKARGELIAPIDADDLWAPSKVELQLDAMERGGVRTGFVYTAYRRIDMQGLVLQTPPLQCVNGRGLLRSIFRNFVGNGSALLFRRAAFEEVGGYDPGLRKLGLEGAEDALLQIGIARHWNIACVPYCLVGYRRTPVAMSLDSVRMLRSRLAVIDLVATRYSEVPDWVLRASRADVEARLAIALAMRCKLGRATRAMARSLRTEALCGLDRLLSDTQLRIRRAGRRAVKLRWRARASPSLPSFYELDPADGLNLRGNRPNGWMIRRLEAAEADFPENGMLVQSGPSEALHSAAE